MTLDVGKMAELVYCADLEGRFCYQNEGSNPFFSVLVDLAQR